VNNVHGRNFLQLAIEVKPQTPRGA
jgi:hypothetical protein